MGKHLCFTVADRSYFAILKKQIARLNDLKMKAYMASELEFFLFDESYETASSKGYRNLKTAGSYIEDYNILQTTKEEGVMRAIRNGLQDETEKGRSSDSADPSALTSVR